MRRPRGSFIGEFHADLSVDYGDRVRVSEEFGFYDTEILWIVPRGFVSDGASFPWWLRWIPAYAALALVGWCDWSGWSAAFIATLLQALVGWPLKSDWREAAALHDAAYSRGDRPKFACDVMFLDALRMRIWKSFNAGQIGSVRAQLRVMRALVMCVAVVVGGWFAWWGHRRRDAARRS